MKANTPVIGKGKSGGHSLPASEKSWPVREFADICDRVQESTNPAADGTRLYLGLEHLTSGFPGLVGRGVESDVKSNKTAFQPGDVLFGKLRPYLRKSARVHAPGICSTDILVFRSKPEIDPDFLCLLTHTDEFVSHAKATTSGVQHPRTSWSSLKDFKVAIPPLPQQKKIAAVLEVVLRAIDEQERLSALTAELKVTLLHQLFTQGLRKEPQKQTEIGPVPQSWEVVPLIEAVDHIDYGISAPIPKTRPVNGVKIVSTADITKDGRLLYDNIRYIEAPATTVARLTLRTGDVLFNWRNSAELVGKSAVFQEQSEPHVFASFILRIRCGEKRSHNYYLTHLMNQWRQEEVFLKLARRAVNQANYNRNEISVLKIPLPSYEEQREIAGVIRAVDDNLDLHRRKRAVLVALFRTLLHELMTATVRVDQLYPPRSESADAA